MNKIRFSLIYETLINLRLHIQRSKISHLLKYIMFGFILYNDSLLKTRFNNVIYQKSVCLFLLGPIVVTLPQMYSTFKFIQTRFN